MLAYDRVSSYYFCEEILFDITLKPSTVIWLAIHFSHVINWMNCMNFGNESEWNNIGNITYDDKSFIHYYKHPVLFKEQIHYSN